MDKDTKIFIIITQVISLIAFLLICFTTNEVYSNTPKSVDSYTDTQEEVDNMEGTYIIVEGNLSDDIKVDVNWVKEEIDIQAIITIESSGNPHAYNKSSKAKGCMQITPIVLEEYHNCSNVIDYRIINKYTLFRNEPNFNKEALFNRDINIMIGTWYLNRIRDHYCVVWDIEPSITNILVGYNWGPSNMKKWYRSGAILEDLPVETQDYLKRYEKLTK